jgi:hypothetical protein
MRRMRSCIEGRSSAECSTSLAASEQPQARPFGGGLFCICGGALSGVLSGPEILPSASIPKSAMLRMGLTMTLHP